MAKGSPEHLRDWVDYLAVDIGRRPAHRPDRLKKIADRLSETFTRLGYNVSRQPVPSKQTHLENIIAFPRENDSLEKRNPPLLVVGAHNDSVSQSPGADDNASGIAVLVDTARLLSGTAIPGLRLVAFCPEAANS